MKQKGRQSCLRNGETWLAHARSLGRTASLEISFPSFFFFFNDQMHVRTSDQKISVRVSFDINASNANSDLSVQGIFAMVGLIAPLITLDYENLNVSMYSMCVCIHTSD